MPIKIILIAAVCIIGYFLVHSTANSKNVALRRLLLLLFVIAAIFTIIFPDITGIIANTLGVGRGTDLLLYMLIIAFLGYAVVNYRRLNILEIRLTNLSRELTIARSHPENLTAQKSHLRSNPLHQSANTNIPPHEDQPREDHSQENYPHEDR